MYGYVVPYKKELRAQDFVLYRSFYCGVCCALGKNYGTTVRLTTNYDITLFSLLLFDYTQGDLVIEEHGCILNPKRKAIVQPNPQLQTICALNVILTYFKAKDAVTDKEGFGKKTVLRAVTKPYRKARAAEPELDKIVSDGYARLEKLENAACESLDRVADCFASLYRDCAVAVAGDKIDDNFTRLCYNIGKFVYLADALDDVDEDAKKKRYNPYLKAFGLQTIESREKFFNDYRERLEFSINTCVSSAIISFNAIKFTQCRSLLANIITRGLPEKVNEILSSKKKLNPPKI